jgi:hypothetical protein
MWTASHATHALNPLSFSRPRSATANERPTVAKFPLFQ